MAADDPNIEREGQTQYAPFMKDSEMEKLLFILKKVFSCPEKKLQQGNE